MKKKIPRSPKSSRLRGRWRSSLVRSIGLRLLLVLICSLSLCGAPIEILKLEGTVSVSRDKGIRWKPLKSSDKVRSGQWIKTDEKSLADFELPDGSLLRIQEESVAIVEKATLEKNVSEIQLDVREGRILTIVHDMAPASKFEVKTSEGVCGARGENTVIEIVHDGKFRCFRGTLIVVYASPHDLSPALQLHTGMESIPPRSREIQYTTKAIDDSSSKRLQKELKQLQESADAKKKETAKSAKAPQT